VAIRRRSPIAFFLLVFALSAPLQVLGALVEAPAWVPMDLPLSALMFVTPLVAALILVLREEGAAGVRRLLSRTADLRGIGLRWYAPILLTWPLVTALGYALMVASGAPLPEPHVALAALPVLLVVFVIAAAFEEAGWMGYAADPLRKRWGALNAGLVMGVVWGAWHLLPWSQVHPPAWVLWQFVGTVATRVLIFWLYGVTGGSVASAVLFHAMCNVSVALFPNDGSHYDPAFTAPVVVLAAVLVSVLWGPRTLADRRRPPRR